MKRFLLLGLVALGVSGVCESSAFAFPGIPQGIGGRSRRTGRVEGYWLQPSRGPLYDYSSYFANKYPWLPGAQEYQGQPTPPSAYGMAPVVVPAAPVHQPIPREAKKTIELTPRIELTPLPPK